MIRSGAEMNAPSMTFASTRDLVSTFSRFQMPRRVCISHREVRTLLARGLRVAGGRIAHGQRDVTRGHVLAGADADTATTTCQRLDTSWTSPLLERVRASETKTGQPLARRRAGCQ